MTPLLVELSRHPWLVVLGCSVVVVLWHTSLVGVFRHTLCDVVSARTNKPRIGFRRPAPTPECFSLRQLAAGGHGEQQTSHVSANGIAGLSSSWMDGTGRAGSFDIARRGRMT